MRMNELLFNDAEETIDDNVVEKLKNHLQKNCQDIYKKFYKNSNIFLYHSPDYDSVLELKKSLFKTIKNTSRNLDTEEIPHYYHEKMDDHFKNEFGLRFRTQSLFTFPSSALDRVYSNPVVFPHDGFQMLSSINVKDPFFNIKNCFDSQTVTNIIGEFLLNYIDSDKLNYERIDTISSLTFNMLNKKSFFHSKDFPENVDEFIDYLNIQLNKITGLDLSDYDIDKINYKMLLDKIVNHCDYYIDELLTDYSLVKNKTQLKKHIKSNNKETHSEIMVYSDYYTLVRFDLLYNYVSAKLEKKKAKPVDVINFLYSY